MILLLLLSLSLGNCRSCESELRKHLDADLVPRIKSFHSKQKGLDWLANYTECRSRSDSTFVALRWKHHTITTTIYGLCLPADCDRLKVKQILLPYAKESNISSKSHSVHFVEYETKNLPKQPEKYFFQVCFCLLIIATIISTVFSKWISANEVLSCFNARKNFQSFIDLSKSTSNLDIVDGVRSFCSMIIVFTHCYFYTSVMPLENRATFMDEMSSLKFTLMTGLLFSVDIFFYLAGFFMAFTTAQELRRKGQDFNWTSHFVKRLIRYLPAYLFIIGVERSFPQGVPAKMSSLNLYFIRQNETTPWWWALFFVHNFAFGETQIYLPWTWSIASDFQFFIASSFVLYLFSKNKSLGYLSAFFLIGLSILYSGSVAYLYGASVSNSVSQLDRIQMSLLYYFFFGRVISYLVGVVLGLLYLSDEKRIVSVAYSITDGFGERFEKVCLMMMKEGKIRVSGYATGLILLSFGVLNPFYFDCYGEDAASIMAKSIIIAVSRGAFILGFALVVFPMKFGYLRSIGGFLKTKIFRLSSKISYSVYLVHPFVVFSIISTGELVDLNLCYSFAKAIKAYFITAVVGTFVYTVVESPFYLLERKYLPR